MFLDDHGALVFRHNGETVRVEEWGKDSLRVRATRLQTFSEKHWALSEDRSHGLAEVSIASDGQTASISNGHIRVDMNYVGVLSFYKDQTLILREYYRNYDGTLSRESRCLRKVAREWKSILGSNDYSLHYRLESQDGEKIFGMGQYQQPYLDLKGSVLDLEQRNSQITIPFALSSLGYGFLWNNPAVGSVAFGNNYTEWAARSTKEMDFWITVADTPKQISIQYADATGHAPEFPEELMGLWQCKLRYRTQQEVLDVAREYHSRGIEIDQIVIDFFHWTVQGDWKFDKTYWPDPKAMVDELHSMGIRVVVSVWPSVDRRSENFAPMLERGLLISTERGALQTYDFQGDCVEIDAFQADARAYLWEKCKANYSDIGIDSFWLDNSEPDYCAYDFDNYRYAEGPALQVSNLYPQMFSRAFYDPMCRTGKPVVNLLRSGWAGSQKYGNVIWSGDVPSTFEALQDQLQCGINMGLAGIPWWTTDIGGFMTDDVNDPDFHQLLIRWYQFAVYTAVFRMHGDRGPHDIPVLDSRDWGGGYLYTGHSNEIWSFGETCYEIMVKYYHERISMHSYIARIFREAHEKGYPLIRAMFYEFPDDSKCWTVTDQYMFGDAYLVAPILHLNQFDRLVYLPNGKWRLSSTGECYEGNQTVHVDAPLTYMPVFIKIC